MIWKYFFIMWLLFEYDTLFMYSFHLSWYNLCNCSNILNISKIEAQVLRYPHIFSLKEILTAKTKSKFKFENISFSWQWQLMMPFPAVGGEVCLNGNGAASQPTSQGQRLCCWTITARQAIPPLSRL